MIMFNKFKTKTYCVVGRHYSGTINIKSFVILKGTKMLKGECVKCKRK